MTSSSTDLRAADDRRRRTRLGWLVAVLAVAVAGPTVASTSALYTSEATTVGTFTVASNNAVALQSTWNPVLRWRFEPGGEPAALAAEHGAAFLPLDDTDAVTLAAASTSGPVPLSLTGDWTIALWVVPGAPGRVLTLDGPSFAESVRLDISVEGRVMLTPGQITDAVSTGPLAATPHFVVLTGSGSSVTLSVDGGIPVPVTGDPVVATLTLGAYGTTATAATDTRLDEVVVAPALIAAADLEKVRTAGSWATPAP